MSHHVPCDTPGCQSKNATVCELTNPRDYTVIRKRMCARCRTKAGLSPEAAPRTNRYAIQNKDSL